MIEDVKASLEPFSKHLEITDDGDHIKVSVKDWLPDFKAVQQIVMGYNGKYTPYNKTTKAKAYFTIPKKAAVNQVDQTEIRYKIADALIYYSEQFLKMAEDLRNHK